jgi:predicted AAA+ superfamily ATPase
LIIFAILKNKTMIKRKLSEVISSKFHQGKSIILIGARQVGKSTMLKLLMADQQQVLWFNADEMGVRTLFENVSVERFRTLFEQNKVIVIDEAQRIENIGLKLKLITDNMPEIQLIATGSSAFELANKVNEPLTGRKWEYQLFPLSFGEMVAHHGLFEEMKHLSVRLVYGYYPDVVCNPGAEKQILHQLTDSYLYKDILEWERIKKPDKLLKLLQALAYQVGSEVSFNELGNMVELDKITVEKYIVLLEQSKVIFRLSSFSRNLRNELKSSKKIYFYDNGIRNALIADFSTAEMRQDIGALWENFMISERVKYLEYNQKWVNSWFWRTTAQQEIDYIEEYDGKTIAYEFKWNPKKKTSVSKVFTKAYPGAEIEIIHRDNFDKFLM